MTGHNPLNSRSPRSIIPDIPFPVLDSRLWLLAAVLLVILAALVLGLNDPFVHYHDYETVLLGAHARHFAEIGYAPLSFQNVDSIGPDGNIMYYSRRVPAVTILLSFIYRIFGATTLVTRIFALIEGILMLVAFYWLVSTLFNRRLAALAVLVFALWPGNLSFNIRHVFWESFGIFLALLTILFYMKWHEARRFGSFIPVVLLVIVGTWTTWEYYPLIPLLVLHWLLYQRQGVKKADYAYPAVLLVIPVLTLAAHMLVSSSLSGVEQAESTGLLVAFQERILGKSNLISEYAFLARVFVVQTFFHFGVAGALLAGGGIACMLHALWRRRIVNEREFWLGGLFVHGIAFFVIVRNILPGHDFLMMMVMPFVSLMTAIGLSWILHKTRSKRLWWIAAGSFVVGLIGWSAYQTNSYNSETYFSLAGHMASLRTNLDDVMFVDNLLETGDEAFTAFRLARYPHFYLSPDSQFAEECVVTLEEFQAGQAYDSLDYYVMHTDQIPGAPDDLGLPPQIYPCPGGDVVDPRLVGWLDEQGFASYEQGIYKVYIINP